MAKKDINKEKNKNNFFKELKSELKKVTWPTFKKLVNNTSAVISIVLILSIIVFVLDVCFENLNRFGVGKIKSLVSTNTEEVEESDVQEESVDSAEGIELVTDDNTETTENVEIVQEGEVVEDTTENSETQTESNSEAEVVE